MKEIKSVNDLIVVPVSYFNGMEKELQKILNKVDIHDMDVMEQVLHMRKWLKTKTVYEETKRLYPNLRLENIHLLLPQEEESSCECTDKTDSEQILRSFHRLGLQTYPERLVPSKNY